MNKENWLVSFALVTLFCVTQAQDTVRVLDPYGRIIIKVNAPTPLPKDTSKTLTVKEAITSFMTMEAFNYYEDRKADKTMAFLKSSLIPGLGFSNLDDNSKGWIYFFLGAGSVYLALSADNSKDASMPLIVYSGVRIFEFFDLSSSVDSQNKKLRYQIQTRR